MQTNSKPHPLPRMPKDKWQLYQECRAIKARYADGIPLNREDRKKVLTALRMHPKGKQKFGVGVNAVIVDTFVGGGRCFFVIRSDGTAEDFSLYKCFGRPVTPHKGKIAAAMARFNYSNVIQKYRMFMALRIKKAV
jgi:uncharacterized protein DUF3223